MWALPVEPVYDAEPADEPASERMPELAAPLSDEVLKIARSHRLADRSLAQRITYALLVRTLGKYQCSWIERVVSLVFLLPLLVLGLGSGLGVMWLGWALLAGLRSLSGIDANGLLYAIPMAGAWLTRILVSTHHDCEIRTVCENARTDGLLLGRLDTVLGWGHPTAIGLYLGVLFGLFWGLLSCTNDHGGLEIEGGFWETGLLALDCLCHGLFLDTFELYDIHIGEKVTHTFQSATVFQLFRIGADALLLLFAFEIYQRWRMRRFFLGYPQDATRVEEVLRWMESTFADRDRWAQRFVEEVLFLALLKEYIRGNVEVVRTMSGQFPWMKTTGEVRGLFLDEEGKEAFRGSDKGV